MLKRFITFLCLLGSLSLIWPTASFAQQGGIGPGENLQTNPKPRDITITANVPDIEPPSIPILIAPSNNSVLTTARPTFTWEESTDNISISHYQLYIDGSVLYSNIPTTATENSSYTLTKSGNQYSLVPKSNLGQGGHTWKIQAVDPSENFRDSATWNFTIDTQAPTLVITKIGEKTTSISSQDNSTLPNPYLEIEQNEPTITGTTEDDVDIQLVLQIPNQANQNFSFSADSSGNWSVNFPILPRGEVFTMNFTVTDEAGNVTIMNGVKFLIKQQYIFGTPTYTPTQTPTVTPTLVLTLSPTPSLPPGVSATPTPTGYFAFPSFTPTPTSLVIGQITPSVSPPRLPAAGQFNLGDFIRRFYPQLEPIPVLPPKEIIAKVLDQVVPDILVELIPEIVKQVSQDVAPIGSAIILTTLPLTATVALASQFGWGLSLQILLRILQALGILPPPKPQGLVFNSQTEDPIPFAILNIQKLGSLSTQEVVVTNIDGIYGGLKFSPGTYQIEVRQQDFLFPTTKVRPSYLSMHEYYKAEKFKVASENDEQLFMIPVDPVRPILNNATVQFSWRLVRERIIRLSNYFIIPLFIISLIICLFYPTLINVIVILAYLLILSLRLFKSLKKPQITGQVVDKHRKPLANVFVRIMTSDSNQLAALLVTDAQGKFSAYLPADFYQVSIVKSNYIWLENNKPQQLLTIDTRSKPQHLVLIMTPTAELYSELFDTDSGN